MAKVDRLAEYLEGQIRGNTVEACKNAFSKNGKTCIYFDEGNTQCKLATTRLRQPVICGPQTRGRIDVK